MGILDLVLKKEEKEKKQTSGGGGSAGALTEEKEEENPLDTLNESIEKNYKEYLKLEKNLSEFDTTLEGIPPNIQPSIIANYNKEVTHFNTLVKTLQEDITKRDQIISVLKKQDFIKRKHLEGQEVSLQKTEKQIAGTTGFTESFLSRRPKEPIGLKDLDKINKYIAAPIKGVTHGIYSTPQAIGGLMRLLGENMQATEGTPNIFKGDESKYTDLMKAIAKKPDKALYKPIDQWLIDKSQEIIKENREFLKKKELHPDMDDKVASWLFQLGSGATSLAGAVGITILTHSPHAGAIAFGMYQTGSMYQEAREADVKVGKATGLAITAGVIEGALEYIGLEWLFTKYAGGKIVNLLIHSAQEGFQEFSQELGQNIVAKVGWDKTRNLLEGCAESASIGAVLGGGASTITTNIEQSTDLTELTPEERKGIIETIVEKQLKTLAKILPNLNPKTIMEKVKTDPDIQKAILGVFEEEQKAFAYKAEPKPPTDLEAKREMLREHGIKEELLADDEFVKKAKITELPKADVTSETVSKKLIEDLEKKWGKEVKLTKEKVLEKVEKPKAEVKEPTIPTIEKKAEVEKVSQVKREVKREEEPPKVPPKPPEKVALEEESEFPKDVKIKDVYTIGERTPVKKVKGKVREITGQTKQDKILIAELDILDLVLKGEEKVAKKAFSEGKKKGIFDQKEHFKDIVARAKERKAQKDYVNKLIKDINNLPTQKVHIDYKDKIQALKDMFDLKKRQEKTLKAREETAKFIEREMEKGNTKLQIPQDVIDTIKKIPLNNMTIAQLEEVHDNILHLAHIGKTKGKLLKIQKGRRQEELVTELVDTLYKGKKPDITRNLKKEIKEAESLKKKVKDIWSHFWINTTLDESLFERMDGAERGLWCETFYDAINKCKDDELSSNFKRIEDSQNFIADNEIDIVKFTEERTGDLMLTPAQRTGVYLCSLDEDAKRHIQKAGVYTAKGMKEPYKFTDKDISNVVDSLTKEEKAMAEHYQEYQLTQGNELDDFDVRVRGIHLKKVKNRYAIQVLNEELDNSEAIELERNPTTRRAYLEQGFRKERTHRAENVINIDCVSNMLRDQAKVEHYKAYEETVMDLNNILTNEDFKNAIINHPKYGRIAYDNIVQWFRDSVKAKQNKILSTSDKALMFLRTSAFLSMLGINVISGTKQLVSLCNAVAETDLSTILSGIEQVALHYNEVKQFVFKRDPQMKGRKGQIDKIMREWMESADAKQLLTGKSKDIRLRTLFLIRTLDEFAVLSVWKGSYDQAINQGKSEEEAIKRASGVIRKTQPMAQTKDLPQWFRDGTVANLFSLFQNQINKNQNYIRHDMFGKLKAGKIDTKTFAHRVLWGWILPSVLIGTITRGRPPEDWKELARDIGTYYIGGWFFVGSIVVNIMQGYGGWMPAPLSFGEEFVKAATYKTWESKFKHGISGICKVIGLPYNQPYRTIEGVEDWLEGETKDARRLIWSKYVLEQGKKKKVIKKKSTVPKGYGKKTIIKPSGYGKELVTMGEPKGYGD